MEKAATAASIFDVSGDLEELKQLIETMMGELPERALQFDSSRSEEDWVALRESIATLTVTLCWLGASLHPKGDTAWQLRLAHRHANRPKGQRLHERIAQSYMELLGDAGKGLDGPIDKRIVHKLSEQYERHESTIARIIGQYKAKNVTITPHHALECLKAALETIASNKAPSNGH